MLWCPLPRQKAVGADHASPRALKAVLLIMIRGRQGSGQRLRSGVANVGIRLDAADIDALLAIVQARSLDELERNAARMRALLGPAASVLEPHIQALRARAVELQQARHLAATDSLTGLANRRAFGEAVRRELARAERSGAPLAVIMLDIDDFKSINDELGHGIGDDVLRAVARCARSGTRQGDVIARIGGDEFALLLPDADEAKAQAIGERVRAEIADAGTGETGPSRVGVSLGISVAHGPGPSVHGLLAEADRNLYRDKAARKADPAIRAREAQHSAA
jgi:diguanylate cyclase (GGDEF)-like protein